MRSIINKEFRQDIGFCSANKFNKEDNEVIEYNMTNYDDQVDLLTSKNDGFVKNLTNILIIKYNLI